VGVAISMVGVGAAQAQQGTGALTGTVFDNATRKPLADVIILVTSSALQEGQYTTTDASGFYRVPGLPPGNYKIRFEKEGFFPNEQDGIALRADVTFRLNPSLALAQGEATDVVVKVRPTVDVGSSTTSTSMNSDFLKRVPVSAPGSKGAASRSFESVASVAPGTATDGYGTGINGASSPENHYAIDGLSVGNPGKGTVGTQLSTEFVEEVNVVTAGYMPEFGRSTGGVLNVVTKSGSNEFHGGVFSYFSPGSLEGKRKIVGGGGEDIANPVVYDPKLSYIGDIGFDIGGPIMKDKLWFYAGFDISNTKYTIDRSFHRSQGGKIDPNPLDTQSFVADSRMIQAMAKLTWSLNADNRVTLSALGTPVSSGGGGSFSRTGGVTPGKYAIDPASGLPEVGGGTVGTYGSQAHQFVSNPVDIAMKWNSQFLQKKLLLDVTLGHHYQVDSRRAADGSTAADFGPDSLGSYYNVNYRRGEDAVGPNGEMLGYHDIREFEKFANSGKCTDAADPTVNCKVADYVAGSPRDLSDATYKRYAGSAIVSYLLNFAGHHIIKAGIDGEMTVYDNVKSNRVFAENSAGTQFNDEERFGILTGPDVFQPIDPLRKQTKSMVIGGFVQDSWSVLDKVMVNIGARYDAQYFYNTAGEVALSLPNQWSPRLGVIYDPTQSGKSKVYVNYARYYENAPLDFADVALSGEPQTRGGHACTLEGDTLFSNQHLTSGGGCQNPDNLRANDEGEVRLPNKIYVSGGAPGTLDPDIQASSQDEISAGGEYEVFPDARVGLTYTRRWVNRWVEDMAPVIGLSGFNGNPGFGLGASFPKVERTYQAFTLALTKTFSNSWLAQGSYTMAFLKGNYAGLIAPEDGYLGPNATADFDSPNVARNRYGYLQGDARHNLKVFASKDWQILPTQHLVTGMSARARSGGATNYLAGDPNTYPMETYLVARGSGPRLPWTFGVDLSLSYRIAMSKGIAVSVTADIFNVLNLQGVTSIDQEYTTDSVIATEGTKVGDLNKVENHEGMIITKKPSFGSETGYQDPRVFRFGVRGEF
jgi:hypothetical protein